MLPSTIIIIVGGTLLYFTPSFVAVARGKLAQGGVFFINLLLGWTLVGWVLAFVWACTGKTNRELRLEAKRHDELLAIVAARKE